MQWLIVILMLIGFGCGVDVDSTRSGLSQTEPDPWVFDCIYEGKKMSCAEAKASHQAGHPHIDQQWWCRHYLSNAEAEETCIVVIRNGQEVHWSDPSHPAYEYCMEEVTYQCLYSIETGDHMCRIEGAGILHARIGNWNDFCRGMCDAAARSQPPSTIQP